MDFYNYMPLKKELLFTFFNLFNSAKIYPIVFNEV